VKEKDILISLKKMIVAIVVMQPMDAEFLKMIGSKELNFKDTKPLNLDK
jgi:hypothetical protein